MNRSDDEKLTDAILGEAVISLLKRRSPINISALIARLNDMAADAPDDRRREAIALVIDDINRRQLKKSVTPTNSLNQEINTVQSLLAHNRPAANKKIH